MGSAYDYLPFIRFLLFLTLSDVSEVPLGKSKWGSEPLLYSTIPGFLEFLTTPAYLSLISSGNCQECQELCINVVYYCRKELKTAKTLGKTIGNSSLGYSCNCLGACLWVLCLFAVFSCFCSKRLFLRSFGRIKVTSSSCQPGTIPAESGIIHKTGISGEESKLGIQDAGNVQFWQFLRIPGRIKVRIPGTLTVSQITAVSEGNLPPAADIWPARIGPHSSQLVHREVQVYPGWGTMGTPCPTQYSPMPSIPHETGIFLIKLGYS